MQTNLTNLQLQQMQIMQQQQQRLANMMQQRHKDYPQPWDNEVNFNKQQEQHMLQMQDQQLPLHLQQQQKMHNIQKEMNLRPQPIPQPTMIPSRHSLTPQNQHLHPSILPPQNIMSSPNITPQRQMMAPNNSSIPPNSSSLTPDPTHIPVRTEAQKRNLEQYKYRDEEYQKTLNIQHKRHIELAQSKKRLLEESSMKRKTRSQQGPASVFGYGYNGYGNGKTGAHTKIRFPRDKKKRAGKREPFRFSLKAVQEQATKEEILVPIRIELEHEGYKVRDTFTWNLNEMLITPEQFAEVICEDLKLPTSIFSEQISKTIKEQIDDYNLNASSMVKDENSEENKDSTQGNPPLEEESKLNQTVSNISYNINKSDNKSNIELRTIIKLDITVGNWELIDQFEWDISCPRNSPEEFASRMVKDLGLGGEFKTAIAHSIREQIHVYIKSLLLVGYEFNNSSIIDDEIRHSFLPPVDRIVRDNTLIERFTPSMIELTDAAVEKLEKDLMREARRKRRGTRARRGIILPDREPQKTHRTGFAIPPEQELTDEQFLSGMLVDPQTSNKRSAALKARMNIAAEAAITVDDIEGSNKAAIISFSNSRNATINDYQKKMANGGYGNMNSWQLNNNTVKQ